MNTIFAGLDRGRKNIVFGITLFLVLGVAVGTPLTMDLFGGSVLTASQYEAWKVMHGYGVFLAFVNFFFGFLVDRMSVDKRQMEAASWSFVVAGLAGGIGRPALFLLSVPGTTGNYAISFVETLGFVAGTFIFIRSLMQERPAKQPMDKDQPASEAQPADGSSGWTWEGWAQTMKTLEAHGVNVNDCINFMKGKTDEYLNGLR
jgi:hypothetical protein